jgi:ATP-dependent Lhr-like helicase
MSQYSSAEYALFLYFWHGLDAPEQGSRAREKALGRLQGYVLPYSDLESRVLPARIKDYRYGELDDWCRAGKLGWQGHERIGTRDGAVSIHHPDKAPLLVRIRALLPGEVYVPLRNLLAAREACEFDEISAALGGFPPQILAFIWDLVWAGEISNARLTPLLSLLSERVRRTHRGRHRRLRTLASHGLSTTPPGAAGQWFLVAGPAFAAPPQGLRDDAMLCQLLHRWGVVGARCLQAEGIGGGMGRFSRKLLELEEAGRVSRGEFIDGCGGTQYASPEALELLERGRPDVEAWIVAATDPANPFGKLVPWPKTTVSGLAPQRVAGARVVLSDQGLLGHLSANGDELITFDEPARISPRSASDLIAALAGASRPDQAMLLRTIDGRHPLGLPWSGILKATGFKAAGRGWIHRC